MERSGAEGRLEGSKCACATVATLCYTMAVGGAKFAKVGMTLMGGSCVQRRHSRLIAGVCFIHGCLLGLSAEQQHATVMCDC